MTFSVPCGILEYALIIVSGRAFPHPYRRKRTESDFWRVRSPKPEILDALLVKKLGYPFFSPFRPTFRLLQTCAWLAAFQPLWSGPNQRMPVL
jgi:hypothetical protein